MHLNGFMLLSLWQIIALFAGIIVTATSTKQIDDEVTTEWRWPEEVPKKSADFLNRKANAFRDKTMGTVFVPSGPLVSIQNPQSGHFYLHQQVRARTEQAQQAYTMQYNEEGLRALQQRYQTVHGMPAFIKSLLDLDPRQRYVHDMLACPDCFPYFEDLHMLIIPNQKYEPTAKYARAPRRQKLEESGITVCAWFIHPASYCMTDGIKQLLHELSDRHSAERPLLAQLQAETPPNPNATYVPFDPKNRDTRTIGEMGREGKYYASMLDLTKEDIPMLRELKQRTLRHLATQYGVNEHDDVALYTHFPYVEGTTTLHMHIRANHVNHLIEDRKSFSLDEIVDGLAMGKTIEKIILKRQQENGGKTYRDGVEPTSFFKGISGVTVTGRQDNVFRLTPKNSKRIQVRPRDELSLLRGRKFAAYRMQRTH